MSEIYNDEKCGFLLAEERMRQRTFFLHTPASWGSSVQGFSDHVV